MRYQNKKSEEDANSYRFIETRVEDNKVYKTTIIIGLKGLDEL